MRPATSLASPMRPAGKWFGARFHVLSRRRQAAHQASCLRNSRACSVRGGTASGEGALPLCKPSEGTRPAAFTTAPHGALWAEYPAGPLNPRPRRTLPFWQHCYPPSGMPFSSSALMLSGILAVMAAARRQKHTESSIKPVTSERGS